MNRNKGFTLVELLVVIAIIGILAVIVVPSIMKVNVDINDRMLVQKKEYIVTAAELYGSNNPDLFNGADEVTVPVWKLINTNYVEADRKLSDTGACSSSNVNVSKDEEISGGCIIDPTNGENILNLDSVLLIKKTVGIVGVYQGQSNTLDSSNETLVKKVCDGFGSEYDGYFENNKDSKCKCNSSATGLINSSNNAAVNQCILVSNKESGAINNWLKYGSSSANWRVIGLYVVDGKVSAKMITSTVVDN